MKAFWNLKHGVYGLRSFLAVNSLLAMISNGFVGIKHEFKASRFLFKAKGNIRHSFVPSLGVYGPRDVPWP